MNDSIDAFPLCWPEGWPRHNGSREWGQFKGTPGAIREELIREVDRLLEVRQGRTFRDQIIISSNIPSKKDGMPMANAREPQDPGIAVYFMRKGKRVCFACDKYDRTWKNMRAIAKTIEALRGIERWGSSDMLDRAFTGFAALPAPGPRPWNEVMDLVGNEGRDEIKSRFRKLAMERHPDHGGSQILMAELNEAYQTALGKVGA